MISANSSTEPLRILLVEDDEFDVAVFHRAFRRSGIPCEILRCSRAEEALEALREAEIELDLLVADHHLPGITGLELCRSLLEKEAPFALALLTGGGSEKIAIKALKAGVQEYIVKDSHPEFLEILPLILRQVAWRHRDQLARQLAEEEARHYRNRAVDFLYQHLQEVVEGELGNALRDLESSLDQLSGEPSPSPSARETTASLRRALTDLQRGVRELPGRMRKAAAGLPSLEVAGPATETPSGDPEQEPSLPNAQETEAGVQVLIVQDNPVVAALTAAYVESLGLRYVPVGDGRQALEALEREPFDLVLLDIHLPDLGGFETCRRLREREARMGEERLRVLGVPADEENREGQGCLDAGMDGFVTRPMTFEKLRHEIRRLMPERQLESPGSGDQLPGQASR